MGDALIIAIFFVTVINMLRYISSLRVLLYLLRDANPMLYQKIGGEDFFFETNDMSKPKRLFHYIKFQEYRHHHDEEFIAKCNKVRHLSKLCSSLFVALLISPLFVALLGL
ncbi:MAG: universal stress protein UspB [Vibrionaceae bacterium]